MSERGLSGSLGPHVQGCEVGGLLGVGALSEGDGSVALGGAVVFWPAPCRWRIPQVRGPR